MKRLAICTVIFATALVLQACAQAWTPDADVIAKLESSIKLPSLGVSTKYPSGRSPVITEYDRYYMGYTDHGQRMIRGEFVMRPERTSVPTGIHLVPDLKKFPIVLDGGCAIVHIVYAVETARIMWVRCNGYA
jgi:hypothetical protein